MKNKKNSSKYSYIHSYENSKGETKWLIRWTYYNVLGERKEFFKQNLVDEKTAYRVLLETQVNIVQGNSNAVDYKNMKIIEWMNIWYETNENSWKTATKQQRKNAINKHIGPLIGHFKLSELDKIKYQRVFINKLLLKYKPSTVDLLHTLFIIAINEAVENDILQKNKFRGVSIPKPNKTIQHLTKEQLKEFLDAAKKENLTNYSLMLLLAYSGIRRGEALGLTWSDIDFMHNTIHINRTRDNKGTRTPKTQNSYRSILLDKLVISQLKDYQLWVKKIKLAHGIRHKNNDFVFISYQNATPIAENTLKYAFDRVASNTKIDKVTPHMLRHTHATLLLSAKGKNRVSVNAVAERLGNTPEMIMNVYAHVLESMNVELVDLFSDVMGL